MTREEAVRILSNRDRFGVPCGFTSGYAEAIEMAIEALEVGRPHGEWLTSPIKSDMWHCSVCGSPLMTDDIEETHFCPNCGSEMRGRV